MSQPDIKAQSSGNSINEKTRVNATLYVLYGIICLVVFATAYVVTFAGSTSRDIEDLKADKLETDTFAFYKQTQEYNQRELFRKMTLANKKLDLILKKNKILPPEIEYQTDSLEFLGE